jgi:hypothetical protein
LIVAVLAPKAGEECAVGHTESAAETLFQENDPEGVAFEYEVLE